jgi:hypothetical protein
LHGSGNESSVGTLKMFQGLGDSDEKEIAGGGNPSKASLHLDLDFHGSGNASAVGTLRVPKGCGDSDDEEIAGGGNSSKAALYLDHDCIEDAVQIGDGPGRGRRAEESCRLRR